MIKQQATSNKQQATSNKQQATSNKQQATSNKQQANLTTKTGEIRPFLKWAGGKRQLLPEMTKYVPDQYGTYFEPFIGGGAFLLSLNPKSASINDFNPELAITWQVVKDQPGDLIEQLRLHKEKYSAEHYYEVRGWDRDGTLEKMSDIERAARFIFMNRTGFNGLWRVNKKQQNNVPFAKATNPNIENAEAIRSVSAFLNQHNVQITNLDFEEAVASAQTGDFVYFDPPYIPVDATSSFASYTADGFGYAEQVRLRDLFINLTKKGVKVLYSNADVPMIDELFEDVVDANIHHVEATRMINSIASKRGKVGEVLITNFSK
jgi:DNA adenine methylase